MVDPLIDLTTIQGVSELMRHSQSELQWDSHCDQVKAANNGDYPNFWFETIVLSGLMAEVTSLFQTTNR